MKTIFITHPDIKIENIEKYLEESNLGALKDYCESRNLELKIINNLTQEINSSELSDINLILYRTSSIEELKTSKIQIKNLGFFS